MYAINSKKNPIILIQVYAATSFQFHIRKNETLNVQVALFH